jgi:hypothetical protein
VEAGVGQSISDSTPTALATCQPSTRSDT